MIHFDFVVSEEDAETILEALDIEIIYRNEQIMSISSYPYFPQEDKEKMVKRHEDKINYLKDLKTKMKYEKIEDEGLKVVKIFTKEESQKIRSGIDKYMEEVRRDSNIKQAKSIENSNTILQ